MLKSKKGRKRRTGLLATTEIIQTMAGAQKRLALHMRGSKHAEQPLYMPPD